jgi:hypothetical protein
VKISVSRSDLISARRAQVPGPARAMLAVVRGVLVQDSAKVPWPGDQDPVGDLGPGCAHPAFGIGVRSPAAGRGLHHLDPRAGEHCVECPVNCPARSRIKEPEPVSPLPQVYQQVPCLLNCPRTVRVCGHTQDMHVAGADLDDEEHVQAAHGDRAVQMEEVKSEPMAFVTGRASAAPATRRGEMGSR